MVNSTELSGLANPAFAIDQVYSFKTSPATEFSPRETGRFGAFKVLGFKDKLVCVVALNGIFFEHPTLGQVEHLPVRRKTSHQWANTPGCAFIVGNLDIDFAEYRLVGHVPLSLEEVLLFDRCHTYTAWNFVNHSVEVEWRWEHDREAYDEEFRLSTEASRAKKAAEEERLKNRLKTLTWEKLLSETPLARWIQHPPFPPEQFVIAARERLHQAARQLQALGPKPKRRAVRAVLKSCVEWFNEEDEKAGNVIETEEREDLYAALEELAFVARQKSIVGEVDEWRSW